MDHKTMRYLVRHPAKMMRYQATGKLPRLANPRSPLIDLLKSLYPSELCAIRNVTINLSLGYTGSRRFNTASQALDWLVPRQLSEDVASESWQDRRFHRSLSLEDLVAAGATVPERVSQDFERRNR